ncbi:hypothetical protein TYRP_013017 [Tyrophagus putrescentiae]|nr:hypothetical protein TYRP_013017 [Tyrophagus putrescentiae]
MQHHQQQQTKQNQKAPWRQCRNETNIDVASSFAIVPFFSNRLLLLLKGPKPREPLLLFSR